MQKSTYEFISRQTSDPIVERRTCRRTGKPFAIFQSDIDFLNKISPTFDGKKYQIPLPTLCPEERQRRRLMFRNERKLYKRKCGLCGKQVVSMFSPEKQQPVYCHHCRWQDTWDAQKYQQDYTFDQSFTEQYATLRQQVPELGLTLVNVENSDYTNGGAGNKNCYLLFIASYNESCMYSRWVFHCQYVIDCDNMHRCTTCYHCDGCTDCNKCFGCKECNDCADCYDCVDCSGCSHCTNCNNLTNKSYCIANKQYSKEEYVQQRSLDVMSKTDIILSAMTTNSCEQCVGHQITNSKHSVCSFSAEETENIKYCRDIHDLQDAMDINFESDTTSRVYECCGLEKVTKSMSIFLCLNIHDCYYCHLCFDSSHLFGCIGLRNKQYCIFNKQYSKEEYEILVPKIIGHMMETGERGEFFDPSLSPFGYNETVAQEYFPLTREEAVSPLLQGEGSGVRSNRPSYKRMDKEYPVNVPEGTPTIDGRDDHLRRPIAEISDDILTKAIICEVSGRPFRLVKPELEFYRKHGLPIPRKHPDVRHAERLAKRPGRELHLRNCDKCGVEMLSVYKPSPNPSLLKEGKGKVYCEECYQTEIYG